MSIQELIDLIARYKFSCNSEKELQEALASLFARNGIAFEREVRLNKKDTIDFLLSGIGLECKIARPSGSDSPTKVLNQLWRYAASDKVSELLLVTSRMKHDVPASMRGKPVSIVQLWRNFL